MAKKKVEVPTLLEQACSFYGIDLENVMGSVEKDDGDIVVVTKEAKKFRYHPDESPQEKIETSEIVGKKVRIIDTDSTLVDHDGFVVEVRDNNDVLIELEGDLGRIVCSLNQIERLEELEDV